MSRLGRILGRATTVALVALTLALAAWLLRDLWLPAIVRSQVAAALASELGADVQIGPITGSMLRDVEVRGISVRSLPTSGLALDVVDADVAAAFELGPLVNGDLGGLRGARIHAGAVAIRLPAAADDASATADGAAFEWPELATLRDWAALLPDGGTVDVDEFTVVAANGRQLLSGPLHVTVTPRPRRTCTVRLPSLRADVWWTDDGLAHGAVVADDAPAFAAALGLESPLVGGRATLAIDVDIGARDVRADIAWHGGEVRARGPATFEAAVHLRRDALRADVDADGPGATVSIRDLGVPLTEVADIVRVGSGTAIVEVRDLGAWRERLPEELVAQFPIRGRVRVGLQHGALVVGDGFVSGRTIDVRLDGGRLPLDATNRTLRGARIAATVTARAPYTITLDGGRVDVLGTVRGELSGSLDEPLATGAIELGAGHAFDQEWATLRGRVAWRDGVLLVDDLTARGVHAAGTSGSTESLGVDGRAAIRLPTTADDTLGLDVDLALAGSPTSWLDRHAPHALPADRLAEIRGTLTGSVSFGASPVPVGEATIDLSEVRLRDVERPSRVQLVVRAAAPDTTQPADTAQALDAQLRATLAPELGALWDLDAARLDAAGADWTVVADATARITTDELEAATVHVDVATPRGDAGAPLQVVVDAARARDGTVTIGALDVGGPFELHARGSLPTRDVSAPLDLTLSARVADARSLASLVAGLPPGGSLDVDAHIGGTLGAPDGDATVRAQHPDAAAVLASTWPIELGAPPHEPLVVHTALHLDDGALRFDTLELRLGNGRGGPANAIGDAFPPANVARAALDLRGTAPLRITGSGLVRNEGALTGTLDVELPVSGVGTVVARIELGWTETEFALRHLRATLADSTLLGELTIRDPLRVLDATPFSALEIGGALRGANLQVLQLAAPLALGGTIDAELQLDGTLGAPAPVGTVRVRDARFKLAADIPIVDAVTADITATRNSIRIDRLTGTVGGGSIRVERGTLACPDGTTLIDGLESAAIDLALAVDDALVVRSAGKKLRVDAQLVCTGTLAGLDVTGNVTIGSGRFIQRISLVPDLSTRGGNTVGTGIDLFRIAPPFGDRLRFDVAINTAPRRPIDVITNVLNTPLTLALRLRGTGSAPYLDGVVSATTGSLRLPAVSLDVNQLLVRFTAEDPRHPDIRMNATTRRLGIDVTANAIGRLGQVEVMLTSSPPLTQQELVVLVSTGVLPTTLQEQGVAGRASMVGGYLAQEIFDFYFGSDSTEQGASIADRFHFYSGRDVSRNGVESLVIDFDIAGGFALEGERDVYEDYNMGVLYRVRF